MPNGELTYKRGEIYWVNLNPTQGAETRKIRPSLILQNNIMNQYGLLTIVIPFRTGAKKALYIVNVVSSEFNGLNQDSFLDLGQIRAIDNRRIGSKIGELEKRYWQDIRKSIDFVLGFKSF